MPDFLVGETPKLSLSIMDVELGLPNDPTTLILKIRNPQGQVTSYTYGTDPIITREMAGEFSADLPLTIKGIWYFRWETEFNAIEGSLNVNAGRFNG
jgi:hypothetical protein